MDTLVAKPARRARRRHSEEFKRQVVEACLQPGVSVAAVALANGLNANYLRQLVRAHRESFERGEVLAVQPTAVVPVRVAESAPLITGSPSDHQVERLNAYNLIPARVTLGLACARVHSRSLFQPERRSMSRIF